MDLNIITDNATWILILVVIGFAIWKFFIQPIENEGKPIDGVAVKEID